MPRPGTPQTASVQRCKVQGHKSISQSRCCMLFAGRGMSHACSKYIMCMATGGKNSPHAHMAANTWSAGRPGEGNAARWRWRENHSEVAHGHSFVIAPERLAGKFAGNRAINALAPTCWPTNCGARRCHRPIWVHRPVTAPPPPSNQAPSAAFAFNTNALVPAVGWQASSRQAEHRDAR